MTAFDLQHYQPGEQLYLWWLANPAAPRLIGELRMARSLKGVSLVYAPAWCAFPAPSDRAWAACCASLYPKN